MKVRSLFIGFLIAITMWVIAFSILMWMTHHDK